MNLNRVKLKYKKFNVRSKIYSKVLKWKQTDELLILILLKRKMHTFEGSRRSLCCPATCQLTWAVSRPVGCCRPHPTSPFNIITEQQRWYSFYRPAIRMYTLQFVLRAVRWGITIKIQIYTAGFDPKTTHTVVRHVTDRPLRHDPRSVYTMSATKFHEKRHFAVLHPSCMLDSSKSCW